MTRLLACFPSFCPGQVGEELEGPCLLEVDTVLLPSLCCSAMETCRSGADWRTRECLEELDLSTLLWTAEKLLSECCLERSGGGKLAEIAPNARVRRGRCSGCTLQFHHLFSGYRRKQKKVMGFELSTKGFILKGTPEERGPVECFTIS